MNCGSTVQPAQKCLGSQSFRKSKIFSKRAGAQEGVIMRFVRDKIRCSEGSSSRSEGWTGRENGGFQEKYTVDGIKIVEFF